MPRIDPRKLSLNHPHQHRLRRSRSIRHPVAHAVLGAPDMVPDLSRASGFPQSTAPTVNTVMKGTVLHRRGDLFFVSTTCPEATVHG
jgi:hypothetical protein